MLPLEFKPIKPETVLIAVTPSAPPSFAARAIRKEENDSWKYGIFCAISQNFGLTFKLINLFLKLLQHFCFH